VDFTSDPLNCGACDKKCKQGAVCQGGQCVCPATLPDDCPTLCTDLKTDANNCGACGTSCAASNASVSCAASMCMRSCNTGYSDCDGDLTKGNTGTGCEINTTNDSKNCGMCGTVCTDNKVCSSSNCECPVPAGGGTCDVFPLCGCMPGEACIQLVGAAESCHPPGTVQPYQTCKADTDCILGYGCVDAECKPFCAHDMDCMGTTQHCRAVELNNMPVKGENICAVHCNIVTNAPDALHDGCSANNRCLWFDYANGITDCYDAAYYPIGAGTQDVACTDLTQCANGFTCINSKCAAICRAGSGADCKNGYSCKSFSPKGYDALPDGTKEEIGYCSM
jgi:hypothetical protein